MVYSISFLYNNFNYWDNFVKINNGVIYSTSYWNNIIKKIFSKSQFFVVIVENEGNIACGIPIVETYKYKIIKVWNSLPNNYSGIIGSDAEAITYLLHYLMKSRFKILSIKTNPFNKNYYLKDEKNSNVYLITDINKNEIHLFNSFSKNTRWGIRNALKNNLTFGINNTKDGVNNYYELYRKTMNKLHVKNYLNLEFFLDLLKITPEYGNYAFVYDKNIAISGAIFLHYNKNTHYWNACSDPLSLKKSPNNLLIFEAMKHYKQRGFLFMDLGGGNNKKTLNSFKLGFGAVPMKSIDYRKICII